MTPDDIEALFTREKDGFVFARWGRPIAPVVFGVDDATLNVVKDAIAAVVTLANHSMAETDPELGGNLMMFFFSEWDELTAVPNMDQLVPDLGGLVARLKDADATQYRFFRFDDNGAIKAAFVFVRMNDVMSDMAADDLALSQAVQIILLWGDRAFATKSPLARMPDTGTVILRPDIADVVRAAYDPVLPVSERHAAHALRISARI